MTEYRIMTTNDATTLGAIVTKYLEQGWEIHGSPFYANGMYCQSMTKK